MGFESDMCIMQLIGTEENVMSAFAASIEECQKLEVQREVSSKRKKLVAKTIVFIGQSMIF